MIFLDLFLGFLKVGCFSFGGAYGAIPLIRDVVLAYGWMSDEELSVVIAISESTPGPIMVNLATYVGSSQAGLLGALIATFAVVMPAFFIILGILALFHHILKNRHVQAMLDALKACVTGIILVTGLDITVKQVYGNILHGRMDWTAFWLLIILLAVFCGSKYICKKNISSITFIAVSAVCGILIG